MEEAPPKSASIPADVLANLIEVVCENTGLSVGLVKLWLENRLHIPPHYAA